ncbi:MAG: hypothetical protein P9E88_09900 [Candidatus Competibacter sp.]|nr:hypothetical protein [Candidatus Competibacter sp.]
MGSPATVAGIADGWSATALGDAEGVETDVETGSVASGGLAHPAMPSETTTQSIVMPASTLFTHTPAHLR